MPGSKEYVVDPIAVILSKFRFNKSEFKDFLKNRNSVCYLSILKINHISAMSLTRIAGLSIVYKYPARLTLFHPKSFKTGRSNYDYS